MVGMFCHIHFCTFLRYVPVIIFAFALPLPHGGVFAAIPPTKIGIRVDERERYITANAFGVGRPGTDLVVLIDEATISPQLIDVLRQQLSMLSSRFSTSLRLRVKFVSYGMQAGEKPQLSMDDLTDFVPLTRISTLQVPAIYPSIGSAEEPSDLLGALDWVASRSSWTPLREIPEVSLAVLLVSRDVSRVPSSSISQIREMLGANGISLTAFGVDVGDSNALALAGSDSGVLTLDALKLAGVDDKSLLVPLFGSDTDRWTVSVLADGGVSASHFEVADLMQSSPRNVSVSTSLIRIDKQISDFPRQWVFPVKALFREEFAKKDFSVFLTFYRSGVPLASTELFRYRFPRFSVYQWYLDGSARAFFPVVSAGSNIPITILPQSATFLGFSGFPTAPWVKITQPKSPIFSVSTNIRTQTYGAGLTINGVRQQGILRPMSRGMIRLLSPSFTAGIGMVGFNRYAFIKKLAVTDGINSIDLDGGADSFDYTTPSGRVPPVGTGSPYAGYTIKSAY